MHNKKMKPLMLSLALLVLLCGVVGARVREMAALLPQGPHVTAQAGHWDYQGVIHWHTHYSEDCTGTYTDIAKVANAQHVDFMIATEHNNMDAMADHQEGIYGKTLILTGVEITRPHPDLRRNSYMLGMDIPNYDNAKVDTTDKILSSIKAQHGLAFIAHPQNPRWKWEGPVDDRLNGMEILDKSDEWFTADIAAIARGIAYYPFSSRVGFLQLFHRPDQTLAFWDDITQHRPFVGIYAPDFHQAVHLPFHTVWRFPKVDDILPIAHNHIVTRERMTGDFAHDKALVYAALRTGNVYVALDGLGDATGFMFSAAQGKKSAWMGQGFSAVNKTSFTIDMPASRSLPNVEAVVYRDGQAVSTYSGRDIYHFTVEKPGVYRVEVKADMPAFWGGSQRMTWIYSNPIYIGGSEYRHQYLPAATHTAMVDTYAE